MIGSSWGIIIGAENFVFSLPDSLSVGDLDTFHHAFQEHGHRALEWRRRIIDFELDL